MSALLSKLAGSVLDLLLPLSCAVCHRQGRMLCRGCETALPRLEKPYCSTCAAPGAVRVCPSCAAIPPPIDGIRAPYLFDGAVKDLVHALKYRNLRAAAPELGRLLASYLESNPVPGDVLMPVPLHRWRHHQRGYNQAELLARELSGLAGIPVELHTLRRGRNTPPQVSLKSHEERRSNIQGAFQCTRRVDGQRVLLVDDVATTGSTLSACAAVLKAAGARSVWGLALARQP